MTYPRFEGGPPAPPPPRPEPAPALAPDPANVPDFETLTALGIEATTAFFERHRGHYDRLRNAYFNRLATPANRPVIRR